MMRSRPHDDAMAELYRSDPALVVETINAILADGDLAELRIVMRQLALAYLPTQLPPTPNTPWAIPLAGRSIPPSPACARCGLCRG